MSLKPVYACNYPQCYKHAQWELPTQFSGTLHWCDEHLPPDERENAVQMNKVCRSPYCECPQNQCKNKLPDMRGTYPDEYHYTTPCPGEYHCEITTHEGFTFHGKGTTPNEARLSAQASMNPPTPATTELKQALDDAIKYGSSHPSNKVQYLTSKLQEEAAEVIQAVSKIRRFGPDNHHPDRNTTNLEEFAGELEDFFAIVVKLVELDYLDPKSLLLNTIQKFNKL